MPAFSAVEFWAFYAIGTFVVILFFARNLPHKGMRLRFRRGQAPAQASGRSEPAPSLEGAQPVVPIRPTVSEERPLNVVFNYNGHSWDAYEVLGLPAGSSAEKVEAAFRASVSRVDVGSRPFMEAAYKAIKGHTKSLKASSN